MIDGNRDFLFKCILRGIFDPVKGVNLNRLCEWIYNPVFSDTGSSVFE